jgi:N-acetyl sugar amidotransferase
LQPDTRPQTKFSEEGVCPACTYFEIEQGLDFDKRSEDLLSVCEEFAKENTNGFDCLLGVSGGKDSTRQALFLREKLGLNPLLVCLSYPPRQVTNRGAANLSNLVSLGFTVELRAPAPETWRAMMRAGFEVYTNWARTTELALFSSAPQAAVEHGIQLIFWGEHPGLQLGDLGTMGNSYWDANNLRSLNTLNNGDIAWLEKRGFTDSQLISYRYPSPGVFEEYSLQIVYLGVFWDDWNLVNNGAYAALEGLEIRSDVVGNTGDLYGVTSLDEDWVTLNQLIKYYKYGFGRVTDYVNEDIRRQRLTRQEGIEIVKSLDDSCSDKYIQEFCDYINISLDEFWNRVAKAANPDLFSTGSKRRPMPKFKVGIGTEW